MASLYEDVCFCSDNCYLICQGYFGCAVGKGKQEAKTEIEKLNVRLIPHVWMLCVCKICFVLRL